MYKVSKSHEVSDEVAPKCPECDEGYGVELETLGEDTWYHCQICGLNWRIIIDYAVRD